MSTRTTPAASEGCKSQGDTDEEDSEEKRIEGMIADTFDTLGRHQVPLNPGPQPPMAFGAFGREQTFLCPLQQC